MNSRIKEFTSVFGVILALAVFAGNKANPDAVELAPLSMPVEFKGDTDAPVAFDSNATVTLDCPDTAAVEWLASHFTGAGRIQSVYCRS